MDDGVRRLVRPGLVGIWRAAAPAAPAPAAAGRVLLGVVGFGAALAIRGGRRPPAAIAGRSLAVAGARPLPGAGVRLGVGTLATRAATPAPAAAALAVRLTVVVLGLLAVPAGRVVAGSGRLAAAAAGVPGFALRRRLEDYLGRLERRGRDGFGPGGGRGGRRCPGRRACETDGGRPGRVRAG
jgi:hypothetical protein